MEIDWDSDPCEKICLDVLTHGNGFVYEKKFYIKTIDSKHYGNNIKNKQCVCFDPENGHLKLISSSSMVEYKKSKIVFI